MSIRAVVAVSLAARTVAAQYKLDASWPQPIPVKYNVSQVTAVALGTAATGAALEVHVAQRGPHAPPVLVFNSAGTLTRTWGKQNISSIHGMQSHNNHIFITDVGDFALKEFDALNGTLIRYAGTLGVAGSGITPVQFDTPADVAITSSGAIVVSDGDGGFNNRVLALDPLTLEVTYGIGGGNGTGPGTFSSPHSVAYDAGKNALIVADRGNSRLQAFDADSGVWIGEWAGGACFTVPWGVRVDAVRALMFLADGTTGSLYILSYGWTGDASGNLPCTLLQNITVGVPNKPHEIAYDAATGDVYVAGVGAVPTMQRYVQQ